MMIKFYDYRLFIIDLYKEIRARDVIYSFDIKVTMIF